MDTFGEHAVYCKELHGLKYKHDFVMDVLFDIFRRAGNINEEGGVFELPN